MFLEFWRLLIENSVVSPQMHGDGKGTRSELEPYLFALQNDSELGKQALFSQFRLTEIFNFWLLLRFLPNEDFWRVLISRKVKNGIIFFWELNGSTLKQLANSSTYNMMNPLWLKKKSSLVPNKRVDSLFGAVLWCYLRSFRVEDQWMAMVFHMETLVF